MMTTTFDYIIADIRLRSNTDLVALGLRGFKPFYDAENSDTEAECSLVIDTEFNLSAITIEHSISTTHLAEADADGELFKTSTGYLYTVEREGGDALFHIETENLTIRTNLRAESIYDLSLLRFGVWMMFGVVLARYNAIAIHSSVIEADNRAILFLGESGTGKSTHTRLWRENIEGATLLNDDSPIVRFKDGEAVVYGSPWSGKTPCYKNRKVAIAGFCRLSQAPHNQLRRLSTIAAIGAVLPSCPPQFAHDGALQDSICSTLGELLRRVPAYHLECLPNSEAAQLSYSTIIGNAASIR